MSSQIPEIPDKGRIAAVDYGTVRIGVAITDPDRVLCSPLENYNRRSPSKDAQYFKELAELERIVLFVVGLPVHMSGDESQKSYEARQFGKWLFETTGVPVTFYDERFTTSMAKDLLQEAGLTKKRRKARLDMLSAQILLTAFLENPDRALGSISGLEDR
ncbi:Holliday junction resolvase RuvX [Blastopirellula marina]|uniref:Putative pre-16S rRNA nuclease n=1 Tax=Blastopirellula marina TaxID=124 RepID=A0A2S8G420_9BACT|nr:MULTISPECIES: Holliday junction resolvase RuvX [Pirellulaceae]PQO39198.1 Holliday junction resolvase RuvX [Blastopirellula marina]RCS55506.1 Holliday junction resolvase RuvX [Bremerella cremea]